MPLFGAVEHTPRTSGPPSPPIVTVEAAPARPIVDRFNNLANMIGEPLNQLTLARVEREHVGLCNEIQAGSANEFTLNGTTGGTFNNVHDLAHYLRVSGLQCDVLDNGDGTGMVQLTSGAGSNLYTATLTTGTTGIKHVE
jgi:hypothetical protein